MCTAQTAGWGRASREEEKVRETGRGRGTKDLQMKEGRDD